MFFISEKADVYETALISVHYFLELMDVYISSIWKRRQQIKIWFRKKSRGD
jgi:hypothetical protein